MLTISNTPKGSQMIYKDSKFNRERLRPNALKSGLLKIFSLQRKHILTREAALGTEEHHLGFGKREKFGERGKKRPRD